MFRNAKRFLSLLIALMLVLAFAPAAFAEEAAAQAKAVVAHVKDIITVDGLEFKDLNANGELDVYEDWREDAETRALDLIAQMTVREKIGQMQHPTFVPRADGTIPNYLETWTVEENIGFVLVRELPDVRSAAETMNQIQEWCESSRLGIPVIDEATFLQMASGKADA